MNAPTDTLISLRDVDRARRARMARYNPIRRLDPEMLVRTLDSFWAGDIREAALLWDLIERRDDMVMPVARKRRRAPARHNWTIQPVDDSPRAKQHKDALKFFYDHLTAVDALDLNQRGGMRMLIRQMMGAVGSYYAQHHIVWEPKAGGLTATLEHVPLWWMENRTGRLRFLRDESALEGQDCPEGEWMTTCGDGLMEATSLAFLAKRGGFQSWIIYAERHGMPGIQGKTSAARGSEAWNAMVDAVASFAEEFACVTGQDDSLNKIDLSITGEPPHPKLVERCDRAIAILWRGGDLSTLSAGSGKGQGASLQHEESELLEGDDCELITETLNAQIDPWVIRYALGDEEPLAWVQIAPPIRIDTTRELEVDKFLLQAGARLGVKDTMARYRRELPAEGEECLTGAGFAGGGASSAAPSDPLAAALDGAENSRRAAGDEDGARFLRAARDRVAGAHAAALRPLRATLEAVLAANDADVRGRASAARAEVLRYLDPPPALVAAWRDALGTSVFNGLAAHRHPPKK